MIASIFDKILRFVYIFSLLTLVGCVSQQSQIHSHIQLEPNETGTFLKNKYNAIDLSKIKFLYIVDVTENSNNSFLTSKNDKNNRLIVGIIYNNDEIDFTKITTENDIKKIIEQENK